MFLKADVGPKAASDLMSRLRAGYRQGDDPVALLRHEILAVLGPERPLDLGATASTWSSSSA